MGDNHPGPQPISRLAGWPGELPGSQGYIGTGGDEFRPMPVFAMAGPLIGTIAPASDAIGVQWAPGQGGDTPGGGGAALIGSHVEVETAWVTDGFVVPISVLGPHKPGTVGFKSSRRSRA